MADLEKFPKTEHIIYELHPENNFSWDMIIDAARRDGVALYEYDGRMYQLTVEDLDEAQISQYDSPDAPEQN